MILAGKDKNKTITDDKWSFQLHACQFLAWNRTVF